MGRHLFGMRWVRVMNELRIKLGLFVRNRS